MKQGLLTLAGITLAVAAAVPAHALTSSIQTIPQATYNIAQAYPCAVQGYDPAKGISDLRVWGGLCGNNDVTLPTGATQSTIDTNGNLVGSNILQGLAGATPGTLCLARNGLALDVNCFAVANPNATPPQLGPCFVQAYNLVKQVPGSFKCPDVYGLPHFVKDSSGNLVLAPYQYIQFGTGVRTWWALNFTQPGTKFILSVVSVCRTTAGTPNTPGNAFVHEDVWTWRVVASVATLRYLIDVMHGSAVSTLEVPCIIGEDMYDALIKAQIRLATAVGEAATVTTTDNPPLTVPNQARQSDIGNAIFDMEALIVSNCLFVDVLDPLQAFPGAAQFGAPNIQPPGNLAQTVAIGNTGSAIAGIIDTIENPCCCKLLVDLEWISIKNGLVGQTPTLPTF